MTRQMASIQRKLKDVPGARFASISVDPEHDQPKVLKEYAKEHKADLRTWNFLTGPRSKIIKLTEAGFGLPAQTTHSDKFVIVDKNLKIHAEMSSHRDGFSEDVAKKVKALLK